MRSPIAGAWAFGSVAAGFCLLPALASAAGGLSDHTIRWPTWEALVRVLTLQDYNTRVVIIGTTILGIASGIIGSFLVLRKRALLSDAVAHATLPGICLAFMLLPFLGIPGRSFTGLLLGGAVTGTLGMLSVICISRFTKLKEDAALGIILSVYFGLGIALLGMATRMEGGNAAGLNSFIFGKTASMLLSDALLIACVAAVVTLCCLALFKEFQLTVFDAAYASTQGWPVTVLDILMMALVVVVTVIGLQAVGLILMVALLVIPAAAARFWTEDLRKMVIISGLIGGLSCLFGSALSALMANLPAGAIIVLVSSLLFVGSMTFGPARGLLTRLVHHHSLTRKIVVQHLLRILFESAEATNSQGLDESELFDIETIRHKRSWSHRDFGIALRTARRRRLIQTTPEGCMKVTSDGWKAARRVVRNHRLWEVFLITHADIAPSHVDHGADMIEHVLDAEMIRRLEQALPSWETEAAVPPSPHEISPHEIKA